MTGNPWLSFDRDVAALEVLEHALDLFDQSHSLSLVRAIGHSAATYFATRVRPAGKGRSARVEVTDLMKEVIGPGFQKEWFHDRAWNVGNALKHHGDEAEAATVILSQNSVVFALMCAVADCRKSLGDLPPKIEAWRLRQMDRIRGEFAQDPAKAAAFGKMLLAAEARGELWRTPQE